MAFDSVIINNRFEAEFEGIEPFAIQTVSGLSIEYAKIQFPVGGSNKPLKNQKGRKTVGDITLGVLSFKGDTSVASFVEWLNSEDKKDGYIKMYDNENNVARRWEIIGGTIGGFSEGDLDTSSEGEAIIPEVTMWVDDANIL